jgi:serine/threonine protein kinase/tetratricopeptide (TPR) repeat protein
MQPSPASIESILADAVEIESESERREFLERICGGDAILRSKAEQLIANHFLAGSFLQQPTRLRETAAFSYEIGIPEEQVGPYKLLEQIGEGGMGVVYVAEQSTPVKRRVAIKVIKPGMDTKEVVARFEAERQALALMDHPNIARVFDGGTTAGRPYFVMELVRGLPVTDYCDKAKLSTERRLRLLVQICRAVQHAHQKGIIHRDLKPSNVLVTVIDGEPVPKVIDFGVAKAVGQQLSDNAVYTRHAQLIGTPLYMAPEQAELSGVDVDTRSDVYSLGVLLYELLTGTTPFEAEKFRTIGIDEMRRMIREDEPPRPSRRVSTLDAKARSTVSDRRGVDDRKLGRMLHGELDYVVMKALEKDRNRRYESATAFATDIERYLNDEAVEACPPSAGYRVRKLLGRNRKLIMIASVLGVALLVIAGSIGWASRDRSLRQASVVSRINGSLEDADKAYNAGNLPEALGAARKAEGLLDTLPENDSLSLKVRKRVLEFDTAIQLNETFLEAIGYLDGEGDFKPRLAKYERLYQRLGIDQSETAEQIAAKVRERPVAVELAASLDQFVQTHILSGKREDDPHCRKLMAAARLADLDPWRDQARLAWERNDLTKLDQLAQSSSVYDLPPATLRTIGHILFFCFKNNSPGETARKFLRKVQRRHPDDLMLNLMLGSSLLYNKPTAPDEAAGFYRVVLAMRPDSPHMYNMMGRCMRFAHKWEEAVEYYRHAYRLKPDHRETQESMAEVLNRTGQFEEAAAFARSCLKHRSWSSLLWAHLGEALSHISGSDEAIAAYQKATKLDPKNARILVSLGAQLISSGQTEQGVAYCREAIKLKPKAANFHYEFGVALSKRGMWEEAAVEFRHVIELDPKSPLPHLDLGRYYLQKGNMEDALASCNKAIEADPKFCNPSAS